MYFLYKIPQEINITNKQKYKIIPKYNKNKNTIYNKKTKIQNPAKYNTNKNTKYKILQQ